VASGIVPIVFAACFFFMPETPQYLLKRNKYEQAKKSLQWFRGNGCNIEDELESMKDAVEESERNKV
jgi:hypothetical protein